MEMHNDLRLVLIFIATALGVLVFIRDKKRHRLEIFKASFDQLQRMNEKALDSDDNLMAIIQSANPDDDTNPKQARQIYFHFMRINRIFQAWFYRKEKFISKSQFEDIVDPQIGLLVPAIDCLPSMLERGYPQAFRDFLISKVEGSHKPLTLNPIKGTRL